ncbi:MAG TPA: methylthioribulose 1-phosphate dehydratase [Blastocatellia bacterium]
MSRPSEEPAYSSAAHSFERLAREIAEIGRGFYARGWALGTSGNYSAVLSAEPLRLAITSSGIDKGLIEPSQVIGVDEAGRIVEGTGKPSAETLLHLTIVRQRGAGAVLHTHSIWSTLLSDFYSASGGLPIQGYEMLKGLEGVSSHEHSEWIPIIENSQDMEMLAAKVENGLRHHPAAHAFMLRGHGLYTWGRTLPEARRHIEIIEFLLELVGRGREVSSKTLPTA